MNKSKGVDITDLKKLLHPELLSRSELIASLESLCVKISYDLPTSKIIEIFRKVALPLPPRQNHTTNPATNFYCSLTNALELTDIRNEANNSIHVPTHKMNSLQHTFSKLQSENNKTKKIKFNRNFEQSIRNSVSKTLNVDTINSYKNVTNCNVNCIFNNNSYSNVIDKTISIQHQLHDISLTKHKCDSNQGKLNNNFKKAASIPKRVILKRCHILKNVEEDSKKMRLM